MDEGTSASLMTKSSSFIYRVLLSLQSMQGFPNFHDGVTIEDLVLYMRKNNLSDGDVFNQIKTALNHAISLGYVQQNRENRYRLVVNSATVHQFPYTSARRSSEISRVSNIFPTNWQREKTDVERSVSMHSAGEKSVKKVQTRSSLKENDNQEDKHKEIQELKSPRRSRSRKSAKNSHQFEKEKKTKRRHKSSSCSSSTVSSKSTKRTKKVAKRKHTRIMKTNQNFKQNAKKPKRGRRKHCRDVSSSSSLTSTENSYEDVKISQTIEAPKNGKREEPCTSVNSEERSESILQELASKIKSYCWRTRSTTPSENTKFVKPPFGPDVRNNARDDFNDDHNRHLEERVTEGVEDQETRSLPGKLSSRNEEIVNKHENDKQSNPPGGISLNTARSIVCIALDYGVASGIVAKHGKYFSLTEDGKVRGRSLTPGLVLRPSRRNFSEQYSSDDSSSD